MGILVHVIILSIFENVYVQSKAFLPYNPDAELNIYQLARKHGYPLETHQVVTEDGYILRIHRIPHGKTNAISKNTSVFMMHGIFDASVDWIYSGPKNSLAYALADQGYDVWMGNARGNAESRNHTTLNPDKDKKVFWDFSWHEIGYYDLPAMIDYVLQITNRSQLQYLGYSQGTTTFFVMASTRPEYNNKIKFSALLAPITKLTHVKNPLIKLALPFERLLYRTLQLLGFYKLFPRSKVMKTLGFKFCSNGMPTQEICKQIIFAMAGTDREQLDGGFIPVITANTPAGSSLRQVAHYAQAMKGAFRQFDYYDKETNLKKYGSEDPPKYDLKKITVPIAMYYGVNDLVVSDMDAKLTASELSDVVYLKEVDYSKWTHFDFLWAKDLGEILNKDIIDIINKNN